MKHVEVLEVLEGDKGPDASVHRNRAGGSGRI